MDFACFNVPINPVSFGQVSTLLLRTLYEGALKGDSSLPKEIGIFPIGDVNLSTQKKDDLFQLWLNERAVKAIENHSRKNPCFKLWHLFGSLESFSREQTLLSFYELDSPTKAEINIVRNNKTLFTSQYTCDVFESSEAKCCYVPLAFDSFNFKRIEKKYFSDDRITFTLVGKLEKRKRHEKILKAWTKKFGDNKKYFLNCAIYNHFIRPEENNHFIHKALDGKSYFNVNFVNYMAENETYNDFLNSADINIAMSGGEGWGLPEFHSVAMGKHAVVMNAHGYKGWANKDNSILVDPSGKIESNDNMFFQKGRAYNQGQFFDFDEDDFISSCEEAIKRVKANPLNSEGLKLQEEFSKEKLTQNILKHI